MTFGVYWSPNWWADGDVGVGSVHWAENHWPNAEDGAPPTSPGGAGVFELALEDAATITYTWSTAIEKHLDGSERRASLIDDPAVRYEGQALLLGPRDARGNQARAARTRLARFAALGVPFLLGLPYEALALRADSTSFDVAVFPGVLARADWAVAGVRVLVQHRTYGSKQAVIQAVTADTIEVTTDDGTPIGDAGRLGAFIMPTASVFLDAQQSLERYQPAEPIERWQLKARNADRGWSGSPVAAFLDLDSIFTGLKISARTPGSAGNLITISYFGGAGAPVGNLSESANHVEFQYQTGGSTIADFIAAFQSSTMVRIDGSVPDDTDIIGGGIINLVPLAGGVDATPVEVGIGATIATFAGRPIWNYGIVIDGTVGDSIQTMAAPQDLGGLPFTTQTAKVPDWGRGVAQRGRAGSPDWQWAKKMLWTLGGRWKSFFLPTWRRDLIPTAVGAGTITVTDGEDAGDVRTWFPQHRQHLMLVKVDATIVYARIISAIDNLDGTTTLAIVDEANAPIALGAVPSVVSWLEVCHLESDAVPVTFQSRQFSFAVQARVVQQ